MTFGKKEESSVVVSNPVSVAKRMEDVDEKQKISGLRVRER